MRSPGSSFHVSNLLTYVALAAGLSAVAAALQGSAAGAGVFLAIAALADTFDGRFARSFARSTNLAAIGVELDSLTDAVSFGVAPVVATSILMGPQNAGTAAIWWTASTWYVVSALTRLAFYNVSQAAGDREGFVGVPTPVAALVWSSALAFAPGATSASLIAGLLGAAMIAPLAIPRPRAAGLTLFAAWPVVLVVVHLR
jgi:CDP-diacylglycerol---serine O-phosphatidyltransferase